MADEGVALARRLFMHVKDGGTVTAMDLSRLVSEVEKIQHERGVTWSERDRLSLDLAKAHYDALDWMNKARAFEAALRRIGMPGVEIGYCRDGHEMAVLIARDVLKDDVR